MALTIGDVLYLRCTLCDPPKMKFFVVARVQPLWMFLINSELTAFAQIRPRYVDACPILRHAEHPSFLTHDSFLGCDRTPSFEYTYDKVTQKIQDDPSVQVGRLSDTAVQQILESLRRNRLIPKKYLDILVPDWEAFLHA